MSIRYEYPVSIVRPVTDVFAFLADVTQTPKWLERCRTCEQRTAGAMNVGTKLHYVHSTGQMDGEVVAFESNRHLKMHYWDKMMDVMVGFTVRSAAGGTDLTHTIEIAPRNWMGKLFSPLIRRALPKQTQQDITRLKTVLEQATAQ